MAVKKVEHTHGADVTNCNKKNPIFGSYNHNKMPGL